MTFMYDSRDEVYVVIKCVKFIARLTMIYPWRSLQSTVCRTVEEGQRANDRLLRGKAT